MFRKAVSLTPDDRPTVAEILGHSYFESVDSEVEMKSEFQTRAKHSVQLSGEESLITEATNKNEEVYEVQKFLFEISYY